MASDETVNVKPSLSHQVTLKLGGIPEQCRRLGEARWNFLGKLYPHCGGQRAACEWRNGNYTTRLVVESVEVQVLRSNVGGLHLPKTNCSCLAFRSDASSVFIPFQGVRSSIPLLNNVFLGAS